MFSLEAFFRCFNVIIRHALLSKESEKSKPALAMDDGCGNARTTGPPGALQFTNITTVCSLLNHDFLFQETKAISLHLILCCTTSFLTSGTKSLRREFHHVRPLWVIISFE